MGVNHFQSGKEIPNNAWIWLHHTVTLCHCLFFFSSLRCLWPSTHFNWKATSDCPFQEPACLFYAFFHYQIHHNALRKGKKIITVLTFRTIRCLWLSETEWNCKTVCLGTMHILCCWVWSTLFETLDCSIFFIIWLISVVECDSFLIKKDAPTQCFWIF